MEFPKISNWPQWPGDQTLRSAREAGRGGTGAGRRSSPGAELDRSAPRRASFVKPDVDYVVVLDDVGFEFEAEFAGAFGLGFAARRDKILETDDFGADESFLDVAVNRAGGVPG